MIPGKKYTPEDILAIGWRRRWLIGLPLVLMPLAAAMYAFTLQTKWMSTALIQIVPQQVPQEFVRSTVTAVLLEPAPTTMGTRRRTCAHARSVS